MRYPRVIVIDELIHARAVGADPEETADRIVELLSKEGWSIVKPDPHAGGAEASMTGYMEWRAFP